MKVLPRRRKAVLLNSVLATALLAVGGVAWATVAQGSSSTSSTATTRTATVQRGTVLATVSGSGTLTSPSDAGVNFTTGGTLTEVDVTAGQKVSAGQVLAKVDATSADETLSNAQAQLNAAQANLTQVEAGQTPATSSGSGSGGSGSGSGGRGSTATTPTPAPTPTVNQSQLANAEQQVTSAENSVAAAQRAVDGTVLKAPVSGTVASVAGKVGDSVSGSGGSGSSGSGSGSGGSSSSSSSTLSGFVVITNPSGMEVSADFSESDALKLKAGQAATVTLNADTSQVLNAKVVSISSLPVSSSGSGGGSSSSGAVQYATLLAISGDTSNLRTGLSASVQVVTGEASGALYLPTSAINGTGANASVNVVQSDGTTKRTPVTLGVQGDTDDQIVSGVTDGQKVQITVVSTSGSNGFPSTGFPGGFGGGGGGFGGGRGTRGGGGGNGGGGGGRG
ncbi:efflux RND transporter periplasmic adaptor subunit [Streptacidiphilus neutrinimicus]|uniref:efflux RND transporter periplasmic adaptor subunit n=1 Tax=Streptacidiphilus neutrinimicus TaxID=105420 RepID=UPI000693B7DD|nr:HlyD family efflux transporter periplasmic adaptor subunit [Streptacidiphilus neutrinimicus]